MELQAVIAGLRFLQQPSDVRIITDSTYVAKGTTEWLPKWKANGWRRKQGKSWKALKNLELWQEIDSLVEFHDVRFEVIRGHSGHPENERCDRLAVAQSQKCDS